MNDNRLIFGNRSIMQISKKSSQNVVSETSVDIPLQFNVIQKPSHDNFSVIVEPKIEEASPIRRRNSMPGLLDNSGLGLLKITSATI